MEESKIKDIVNASVVLGMITYRNMIKPADDKVKQREAKRYLTQLGYKGALLDKWVANGLLKRHKEGDGNTAVYYSITEIQKLLLTMKITEL